MLLLLIEQSLKTNIKKNTFILIVWVTLSWLYLICCIIANCNGVYKTGKLLFEHEKPATKTSIFLTSNLSIMWLIRTIWIKINIY